MPDPLPNLRAVFCEALDRTTPEERRAYLDEVCRDRPEVRGRVEALLLAHALFAGDGKAQEARKAIIARSKVWLPTDVTSKDLKTGPTGLGSFPPGMPVTCTYVDKKLKGATPKFLCRTTGGVELKVKYGGTNGEVYGEVAATRLLWALGFGADREYSVRLICRGCPRGLATSRTDAGDQIFDPAAVEQKLTPDELSDQWSWAELDQIDESAGGATRAERDAFKLLAVLIQHSDSKAVQQRIVCVERSGEDGRCSTPLMMINDLGLTFGRSDLRNRDPQAVVNFTEWTKVPVWKNATGCVGNLAGSFSGTLKDPVIGEAGRQFLADLLMQLSDQQIHDLFEAARVNLRPRLPGSGRSDYPTVDEWAAAFKAKRDQIANRRC